MQLAKQMEIQEQNSTEQERQSHSLNSSRKTEVSRIFIFLKSDTSLLLCSYLCVIFLQEKYDQAVMKINQLKEEREELKKKVEAQSEEITK